MSITIKDLLTNPAYSKAGYLATKAWLDDWLKALKHLEKQEDDRSH